MRDLIDEEAVIKRHKMGLSLLLIAKRFSCGPNRIKCILIRNGLDYHKKSTVVLGSTLVTSVGRRSRSHESLGD